jgi:putative endonuclease
MYVVYILECVDSTYYVGCTNDVKRRLHQHNHLKSGARYTKIRRPVRLQYSEEYTTLSEARRREAALKRFTRLQKTALILKGHLSP